MPVHYNQGEERGHGYCSKHTQSLVFFFNLEACLSKDFNFFLSLAQPLVQQNHNLFVSH